MRTIKYLLLLASFAFLVGCPSNSTTTADTTTNGGDTSNSTAIVADHLAAIDFSLIPDEYLTDAAQNMKIFYGHTSHGSQIVTGLEMLQSATHDFASMDVEENGTDLGDSDWPTITRDRLNTAGSDINIVMWSWCGQVSSSSSAAINTYLDTMNQLEQEYPNVTFIYMTGHTDGTGENGTLNTNNEIIRNYVQSNNKIFFDFADIESWDPDGNYYPDTSDDCGWCTTWCASHTCEVCGGCAHSHCFNCQQKGKAFWWLLARIAGWDGQ